jgi:hypothetical protein
MTSFARTAGGTAAAMLAGSVLVAAPQAAQARSAARIVRVACDASALAAKITAANAVPATLRLAPVCTYRLTTPLPQITGRVTLVGGRSTTIQRDAATPGIRILDVAPTGRLGVRGIFLLNGSVLTADGGGIRNAGDLVLSYTTLSGNTAVGNNGGGVANTGRALIYRTVFAANATQGPTGNRDGGAIYNAGTLRLVGSRLNGNVAVRNGGGVYTTASHTARVIQSTIAGNSAANLGGGLYNAGTTSLDDTLVNLNQAVGTPNAGGGIFNAAGTVTLSRSTVRRNSPDNCEPLHSIPGCTG